MTDKPLSREEEYDRVLNELKESHKREMGEVWDIVDALDLANEKLREELKEK